MEIRWQVQVGDGFIHLRVKYTVTAVHEDGSFTARNTVTGEMVGCRLPYDPATDASPFSTIW